MAQLRGTVFLLCAAQLGCQVCAFAPLPFHQSRSAAAHTSVHPATDPHLCVPRHSSNNIARDAALPADQQALYSHSRF